ncbi:MAG: trans-acting enoyl reductase family protein [Gaiellaceae bacterium]
MPDGPLAILGVTGYTGRLVLEQARALGLPVRLVGRRREALDELAGEGEEVFVADARDEASLADAFRGSFAVGSCAGPFLELGLAPVEQAILAGAHYLDTSGEQAFARLIHLELGARAAEAEVAVLPCFGFDYVPGDLAARLAAEGLEPLEEVIAAYSVSNASSSAGTRKTIAQVSGQPQVAWENGRLVESRFGATTRKVLFPFGERDVIEWSGTEPLTIPRHTQVRNVRSYVRAPKLAAAAGRVARAAAPLGRAAARFGPEGPSPEERARARFAVVAEARGPQGGRRVTLSGHDMYGLTGLLIARGVQLLRDGGASSGGVLAPAEAFGARALLAGVAPLLEIAAIDEL